MNSTVILHLSIDSVAVVRVALKCQIRDLFKDRHLGGGIAVRGLIRARIVAYRQTLTTW